VHAQNCTNRELSGADECKVRVRVRARVRVRC